MCSQKRDRWEYQGISQDMLGQVHVGQVRISWMSWDKKAERDIQTNAKGQSGTVRGSPGHL